MEKIILCVGTNTALLTARNILSENLWCECHHELVSTSSTTPIPNLIILGHTANNYIKLYERLGKLRLRFTNRPIVAVVDGNLTTDEKWFLKKSHVRWLETPIAKEELVSVVKKYTKAKIPWWLAVIAAVIRFFRNFRKKKITMVAV